MLGFLGIPSFAHVELDDVLQANILGRFQHSNYNGRNNSNFCC